jgi:hypothetical protein
MKISKIIEVTLSLYKNFEKQRDSILTSFEPKLIEPLESNKQELVLKWCQANLRMRSLYAKSVLLLCNEMTCNFGHLAL